MFSINALLAKTRCKIFQVDPVFHIPLLASARCCLHLHVHLTYHVCICSRCNFSSARAPPSIPHISLCHFCLFPPVCFHSSVVQGIYASALLLFVCTRARLPFSHISLPLQFFPLYNFTLASVMCLRAPDLHRHARARFQVSCLSHFCAFPVYSFTQLDASRWEMISCVTRIS